MTKNLNKDPIQQAQVIKGLAKAMGFLDCGIAQAEYLAKEAPRLKKWLANGMHGSMNYMEKNTDLRLDPRRILKGAQSVIVLLSNYYPEHAHMSQSKPKIARYAYGRDYHKVLRKKLKDFAHQIENTCGQMKWRACVDSAPVMESVWAERAGMGWKGKNSLLLHPKYGSFFFLSVLLTDRSLPSDQPITDHCGNCTRCIDACPTDAIQPARTVDARQCIAYLTIEDKGDIPNQFHNKMNDWLFGCDICQDVCPWNRFAFPHTEAAFRPSKERTELKLNDWHTMQKETFDTLFAGTALKRAGFSKIKQSLNLIAPKPNTPT